MCVSKTIPVNLRIKLVIQSVENDKISKSSLDIPSKILSASLYIDI